MFKSSNLSKTIGSENWIVTFLETKQLSHAAASAHHEGSMVDPRTPHPNGNVTSIKETAFSGHWNLHKGKQSIP